MFLKKFLIIYSKQPPPPPKIPSSQNKQNGEIILNDETSSFSLCILLQNMSWINCLTNQLESTSISNPSSYPNRAWANNLVQFNQEPQQEARVNSSKELP
jgi:hypothetical protein